MRLYLCATNDGDPLGDVLLNEIATLGYDGLRTDVPDDHEQATDLFLELQPEPGSPAAVDQLGLVFLIAGGHMLRATGEPFTSEELVDHVRDCCIKLRDLGYFRVRADRQPAIEVGNEPDLADDYWKKDPALMARTFTRCYEVIREYSSFCPVLSPSISNLNERGFKYLRKMLTVGIPSGAAVAFHRYPHDGDPALPHDGFESREAEADHLMELAQGRAIWLTETGLTEGPWKNKRWDDGWFHSEEFVADTFVGEVDFWTRPWVEALTWYQINDGPDPDEQLDHYGIRRSEGDWKPVAWRVNPTKERMA